MILDEEDIQSLKKNGAHVRSSEGTNLRPIPEKSSTVSAETSINRSILGVLRDIVAALSKDKGTQVSVAAPQVTVKPEINVPEQPRAWDLEVTERGADGRAKKWRITAAD